MHKTSAIAVLTAGTIGWMSGTVQAGASIEALTTTRVAVGLTFPVFVTAPPNDYKRLFIVEQRSSGGVANRADIRILDLTTTPPTLLATPFLSITGVTTASEQGLLGLAFHPNYWSNGFFYVNYTSSGGGAAGHSNIVRYQVSAGNPNLADAGSATTLLTVNQPFPNHNAGWLAFGPEGYLYMNFGDGGSGCDPQGNGQNINTLLGKTLRVDVDGGSPYAIPPTNPFAGSIPGADQIWAYGLRNPWRASFDRLTGDLWIGDVGQDATTAAREEIDFQPANVAGTFPGDAGYQGGRNYGWKCREGIACSGCSGVVCATCLTTTAVEPIIDYHQGTDPVFGATGVSITGGYVYRGCAIPTLRGTYFFADYVGGRIWTISQSGGSVVPGSLVNRTTELDPPGTLSITSIDSFGEDARGELYIVDRSGGEVFKVVPVTATVLPQDLNCDTIVNGLDIAILLGQWGRCTAPGGCLADFDGNGTVNGLDLATQLGVWGPH